MGSISGYTSPKGGSFESFSEPAVHIPARETYSPEAFSQPSSVTSDLNSLKSLISEFLEISAKIETVSADLRSLQQRKIALEQEMRNNPEFEKFSEMINSMGPRR